jgi:hypothetical protein
VAQQAADRQAGGRLRLQGGGGGDLLMAIFPPGHGLAGQQEKSEEGEEMPGHDRKP